MDSNHVDWDVEMSYSYSVYGISFMNYNKERKCFIDFLRQMYSSCLRGGTVWMIVEKTMIGKDVLSG